MKMGRILAKCPKCGNQDKSVLRKFTNEHGVHGEMSALRCDDCGYIFENCE